MGADSLHRGEQHWQRLHQGAEFQSLWEIPRLPIWLRSPAVGFLRARLRPVRLSLQSAADPARGRHQAGTQRRCLIDCIFSSSLASRYRMSEWKNFLAPASPVVLIFAYNRPLYKLNHSYL